MMRIGYWKFLGLSLVAGLLSSLLAAAPVASATEFNRDIRPLFARHCTGCHGGVKRAGQLSFLYRDQALAAGKSGRRAIIPGEPENSEIIRRVISTDLDELMPKPDHGPRLSEAEIVTLRQWIREGAVWGEHWSFVPPKEPARPKLRNPKWPKSVADEFVLARLEREGLKPSPEATPAEWLRRVSLDLTGLPPTTAEYSAFMLDRRTNAASARVRVVDRLLASPHYGERWASMWLDLARYSDTYGFEKDPFREIWPWRDWVIRAFNADLPYDEFTVRQLAGDLLENPTADDLLATAFHRNTQNNTEGGTDDEEYRAAAVHDRVNTTWTAWQATTFGCVQCHAHPYDPFPHRDYYRFAAFFNNTEDCDQNDDFPRRLFARDLAQMDACEQVQRELEHRLDALDSEGRAVAARVVDWKRWIPVAVKAGGGQLHVAAEGLIQASGTLPVAVKYTLTVPVVDGLTAIKVDIFPEGDTSKTVPERGQVFSKLMVEWVRPGISNQQVKLKEVVVDYRDGPRDPRKVLEGEGGIGSYPVMTRPRWGIIVLGESLKPTPDAVLQLTFEHGVAANSGVQGCQLRRFAVSCSTDLRWIEFANSPARAEGWRQCQSLRDRLKEFPGTRVPVLRERSLAATRETRVFIRGNRLTRDELVEPGIPDVVVPPRAAGSLNRLDMARWLVGDRNPLAARVLANRLWAEMFGQGIVETLEDFGTSGAKPTHPELLDHLALHLRGDLRWSVKKFLREIALSATYGQSARATTKLLERDAANRLHARGPRARVTAEMVRDQALAVSGLLSPGQLGPPVYPPQPDGVWSTVYSGEQWNTATNENRFRRAIYTYSRRTAGYPLFLTFDAPTRDACTARRLPSNTPLQALTVMNDPAFLEMAQALSRRMEAAGGSPRQIIERGCRLFTLEAPPKATLDRLVSLYEGVVADLRSDRGASHQLAGTPEQAALVLVANTLLNLDSTLTR